MLKVVCSLNRLGVIIRLEKKFRKLIALTLVAVMVCLSINTVFAVAHEFEEAGFTAPHAIVMAFLHLETSGHCPSCPSADHPSADHDHFSCDHHTYVSLVDAISYRHPLQVSFSVVHAEPAQFIPEVFLSIDTPPHILS